MRSKWFGEIKEPESELNRVVRRYLEYELDALERGDHLMVQIHAMAAKMKSARPDGDTIKIRRPQYFKAFD